MRYRLASLTLILFLLPVYGINAQQDSNLVAFPASYFDRFQPHTALEMVRQVPGFQLDDSTDNARGFGAASGNLLINDRRPSAKQDLPSTILSRIPAGLVERIELIRGQVRGIDLRGESLMVNVLLREDVPATVQWETYLRKRAHHGPIVPSLSLSLSDSWQDTEYNLGIIARRNTWGRLGNNEIFNGSGILVENQTDDQENRGKFINGSLNASRYFGETLFHINTNFVYNESRQNLESTRIPTAAGTSTHRLEIFYDENEEPRFEIGMDAERTLLPGLAGKAIFLYFFKDFETYRSQRISDLAGNQTSFRLALGNTSTREIIGRLELDWSGFDNHAIQANIEYALNSLDNSLDQTLDTGAGPEEVTVPGANSRVEEDRWDLLFKDTWSLGNFELDYGIGAEASTITQSGDAEQMRSFFFLKPQAGIIHSPDQSRQTRVQLTRTVSQLDLNDFVSGTIFQDNDLALGNPDIRPDRAWEAEFSHERRIGRSSVIKLTAFHHWISDVLDLLPLSATAEAPGNIGDGRRWGLSFEGSVPLQWLGLAGARVNLKARWQDSTVIDPVTGEDRVLSSQEGEFITYDVENEYAYTVDFRQDFQASRFAWGWFVLGRGNRPVFKVNELAVYDDSHEINVFVETTRWFGIKMKLAAENILDLQLLRDRTVFTGERNLSPVVFREDRDRTRGRQLTFTLSGVF